MGRFRKATIRDVANRAGVSPTTVSQLLGGKLSACSEETAERVRAAAAELHYTPNPSGQALRGVRTRTIGVCAIDPFAVEDFGQNSAPRDGFIERIWRGIRQEADSGDFRLLHYPASFRQLSTPYASFLDGLVDGILFMAIHEDERPAMIARHGVPVVTLARSLGLDEAVSAVYTDEGQVVNLAMTHLWALGHRRIAHLAGPVRRFPDGEPRLLEANDIAIARMEAYAAWMRRWSSEMAPVVAYGGSWETTYLEQPVRELLGRADRPTAILCANDRTAIGVIRIAAVMGLEVPSVLSVMGIDNSEDARTVSPALSTVDIEAELLGRQAIRVLTSLIEAETAAVIRRAMPVAKLCARGSTASAVRA
jgi:DNA-binding LacI/PurR family transcriptional regulator